MAPKAPSKRATTTASKRPRGRPRVLPETPPVTGFRIPVETLTRLDAIVEHRTKELASLGASISRNALVAAALAEFCDREEARIAAGSALSPSH